MKDLFEINDFQFQNLADEDTEFIPLMSSEDEEQMNNEPLPEELPLLPLRNTVLFPGVVIPITVGRDKSIRLIREAYRGDRTIGVVAQKSDNIEDPGITDLNSIGTIAHIIKMLRMPDGNTTVILQGKRRFELVQITQIEPYMRAKIKAFNEIRPATEDQEFQALIGSIKDTALNIIRQNPQLPSEAQMAIKNIESHSFLVNFISSNMNASVEDKQKILQTADLKERATLVLKHLSTDLQMVELKNQIQNKVKGDLDKQQREYFLHQQIKTIQEELGGNPVEQELAELRERSQHKK